MNPRYYLACQVHLNENIITIDITTFNSEILLWVSPSLLRPCYHSYIIINISHFFTSASVALLRCYYVGISMTTCCQHDYQHQFWSFMTALILVMTPITAWASDLYWFFFFCYINTSYWMSLWKTITTDITIGPVSTYNCHYHSYYY